MTRGGPRPGAGRPPAPPAADPKRTISIKLEESLIAQAIAIGGNATEGIRLALRHWRPPHVRHPK